MAFYWIVLGFMLIVGNAILDATRTDDQHRSEAAVDSTTRLLLAYRSAVSGYAHDYPSFTGVPDDSQLGLPDWFRKPQGLSAYVSAGSSVTYFSSSSAGQSEQAGLAAALVERAQTINVGINRSGVLFSPSYGNTGIAVPTVVPEGAIVALN